MKGKSENKKLANKENFLHFVSLIINFWFWFSIIIFSTYLIAPLLGGKLYFIALLVYGSWIGMALVMKYIFKKIRKKIRMKKFELLLFISYGIICMFLWFSYPLNILFSILIIVGDFVGYRAQQKSFGTPGDDSKAPG